MTTALPSFMTAEDLSRWESVRGWLLPSAAAALYRASYESIDKGSILEIGSFAGKSMICIARGARDRGIPSDHKIVAVDIRFPKDFQRNLRVFGVCDLVEMIEKASLDVADSWNLPIAFLYIDGHHGLAHAYADFVVWDLFVLPGGVVALDDTAGFYNGPLLQARVAIQSRSYDVLSDVGGVTFLRKRKPLFEDVSFAPLGRETLKCLIAQLSAECGALDIGLRVPVRPGAAIGPVPRAVATQYRDRLKTVEDLTTQLSARDYEKAGPTLRYLKAILHYQLKEYDEAVAILEALSELSAPSLMVHYELDVRPLAALRRAQILDVMGQRTRSISIYEKLASSDAVPELTEAAKRGQEIPFQRPPLRSDLLLRQYVIDSPLSHYRAY